MMRCVDCKNTIDQHTVDYVSYSFDFEDPLCFPCAEKRWNDDRANKKGLGMADLFNHSGATISECGRYRYNLWRVWDEDRRIMVFVMQNPSTADANDDDPTIRRCIGFAEREGCGGIVVRNVFALRATDERELLTHPDPVGPKNWDYLIGATSVALGVQLVAAWGNRLGPKKRSLFRTAYCNAALACVQQKAKCLGVTKSGDPKHPFFLAADTPLVPWKMPSY